jgi:hypothetical protein
MFAMVLKSLFATASGLSWCFCNRVLIARY